MTLTPSAKPVPTPPQTRHRAWGFWLPLALQTLLVCIGPWQAIALLSRGQTIVLQTEPVDPYELLRGYYVTLGYDISNIQRLTQLPGWDTLQNRWANQPNTAYWDDRGIPFYVVLQAPAETTTPPQAWTPLSLSLEFPDDLPANQIALRGVYRGSVVTYDLERYYIPEDQRIAINDRIRELQGDGLPPVVPPENGERVPFVVQVSVGRQGNAIPVGLWLEDEFYRF